jgi:hypothetical protein
MKAVACLLFGLFNLNLIAQIDYCSPVYAMAYGASENCVEFIVPPLNLGGGNPLFINDNCKL